MSIPYDRGVLGHILGEISWNEGAEGRPMLSRVAIHAGDYKQGQGFFDLAEDLYNIALNDADQRLVFLIYSLNPRRVPRRSSSVNNSYMYAGLSI